MLSKRWDLRSILTAFALPSVAATAQVGVVAPGGIAINPVGRSVYWTDEAADRIQRLPLDFLANPEVISSEIEDPRGFAVNSWIGKLYWGDSFSGKIQCSNLNGSDVQDLILGAFDPRDLAIDPFAGRLYWLDQSNRAIYRASLDGSHVENLIDSGVLAAPRRLTLDTSAGKLYWSDAGSANAPPGLFRSDLDGQGVEIVVPKTMDSPNGIALDVVAGKIYFADCGMQKIRRANLDGTSVEDVLSSGCPRYIVLDQSAGKIYWTSGGFVHRANFDGSQIQTVAGDAFDYLQGLALDTTQGHIYFLRTSPAHIVERRDLNGANPMTVASMGNFDYPSGIALDLTAGKIYWSIRPAANPMFYRANLDGSALEQVFTDPVGGVAQDLTLDVAGGKMYWTDYLYLVRANLDGSNIETIVPYESGSALWGLALDTTAGMVYWTESGAERVRRANLDGSDIQSLLVTLAAPEGIAKSAADAKLYWADSGNDRILRTDLDNPHVEELVSLGLTDPHDLVLDEAGGKMYWTEGFAQNARIRRADLDGSNVETLVGGTGNPIEISCVPIGGSTIRRGQLVEVECFVWSDVDQSFRGGQIDMPCSLPLQPGATGSVTVQSITSDPDGNGGPGPSEDGIPFLFGQSGMAPYVLSSCLSAILNCLSCAPRTLPGGETRYLATYFFQASECATGEFRLAHEGISMPPLATDTTRFRDGSPGQGNLIVIDGIQTILTVVPFPYGDVNYTGVTDVDDILCVLDEFRGLAACPGADFAPCGGNGVVDVDDILAILDAFQGIGPPCPDPCLGG